jgi:hypothetical protein
VTPRESGQKWYDPEAVADSGIIFQTGLLEIERIPKKVLGTASIDLPQLNAGRQKMATEHAKNHRLKPFKTRSNHTRAAPSSSGSLN